MKTVTMPKVILFLCSYLLICTCYSNADFSQTRPDAKPREVLIQAMTAKLNAKSYRIKVVQLGAGNMNSVFEVDYVAPDRYHAIAEVSAGGRNSGRQELVMIGKDAYSKAADGSWKKAQLDPQRMDLTRWRDQMLIDNLTKAQDRDVELVRREELNAMAMLIVQHSFSGSPSIPAHNRTKTWISVKDGFPYKIESDAGATYQGQAVTVKTTTTYTDYNADIKVILPKEQH
jgi:hypothetical protein